MSTPAKIVAIGAGSASFGEIIAGQLNVGAVVAGNHQLALQCLLLNPVGRDLDIARQILDDYLLAYQSYLPQFWNEVKR